MYKSSGGGSGGGGSDRTPKRKAVSAGTPEAGPAMPPSEPVLSAGVLGVSKEPPRKAEAAGVLGSRRPADTGDRSGIALWGLLAAAAAVMLAVWRKIFR